MEVLQKIVTLVKDGVSVSGSKPITVPGLHDYRKREERLKKLIPQLWGTSIEKRQRNAYGDGTLYTGYQEQEILAEKGIQPDFQYESTSAATLDYIHRKTDREDILFHTKYRFTGGLSHGRLSDYEPSAFPV